MNAELPEDVKRRLVAVEGWLELGAHVSASEELSLVPAEFTMRPEVLLARWQVHAKEKQWIACLEVGELLVRVAPEMPEGHIRRSFALHQLKRTREAYDLLLPPANKFPNRWPIPYNLACYCCQLGRKDEAEKWFSKAMAIDAETVRRFGIVDPDLKPLWDSKKGP